MPFAPPSKIRLDKLLVDRGLAASRERAAALILAGRVLVAEQKIEKPGTPVPPEAAIRLLGDDLRYVSRGGLKLEAALRTWSLDVHGLACADIGASTGGFTDCLLQHGAASVLAVDTGYGQIAHKLRTDPRVTLLERTNARTLTPGSLVAYQENCHLDRRRSCSGETCGVTDAESSTSVTTNLGCHPAAQRMDLLSALDEPPPNRIPFFAMDVSFIGASLVLPAVLAALAPAGQRWGGQAVILVKPQFEAGREHVGKGGIVRDPAAHQLAIDRVANTVRTLGGEVAAVINSPILGMEGNREFLLHARF